VTAGAIRLDSGTICPLFGILRLAIKHRRAEKRSAFRLLRRLGKPGGGGENSTAESRRRVAGGGRRFAFPPGLLGGGDFPLSTPHRPTLLPVRGPFLAGSGMAASGKLERKAAIPTLAWRPFSIRSVGCQEDAFLSSAPSSLCLRPIIHSGAISNVIPTG